MLPRYRDNPLNITMLRIVPTGNPKTYRAAIT
jgi:hypothetical protein